MELPVDDIATCFCVNKLLSLSDITTMVDTDYNHLLSFVKGNQCFDKLSDNHIVKLFHSVMDDLSVRIIDNTELVLLGMCIVVPFPARKLVVRGLHHAYFELTKTLLTAQQLYYWPCMRSDIKTYIDAYIPCQQARPSQARQKLLPPASPSHALQPMRSVNLDLFSAAGQDWLAMVDRFSGYEWTERLVRPPVTCSCS